MAKELRKTHQRRRNKDNGRSKSLPINFFFRKFVTQYFETV